MRWHCVLGLCLLMTGGVAVSQTQTSDHGAAARDYIGIYQKYLSGLKHTRCPMYPTCSQYGMMAFADHPFHEAMILTADRLLRCSGHPDFYPTLIDGPNSGQQLDYPASRPIPSSVVTSIPTPVAADNIIPTDSVSRSIQFTNTLINQHCYASAMLEIDRLLYEDSSLQHVPALYLNKLRCFEGMRQYTDGLLFYEQRMPDEIKANYKVKYTAAHLYDLIGDYSKSIDLYQQASLVWDSNEVHPYGELAKLYAQQAMFNDAKAALEHKCALDNNLTAFASSSAALSRLEKATHKDPTTAMIFSIVPGGGYLYTEQPRNALVSLLVNGVLAYAVYTSIKTENYGLGIILGAFSISFYGGNIVGSGASATRYNDKIKRDAITELRNTNPFYY